MTLTYSEQKEDRRTNVPCTLKVDDLEVQALEDVEGVYITVPYVDKSGRVKRTVDYWVPLDDVRGTTRNEKLYKDTTIDDSGERPVLREDVHIIGSVLTAMGINV